MKKRKKELNGIVFSSFMEMEKKQKKGRDYYFFFSDNLVVSHPKPSSIPVPSVAHIAWIFQV